MGRRNSSGVNILFSLGNSTRMADCDLRNSTRASKACFGPYPLNKCKSRQIWPTLKWKSFFFVFFFIFHEKSKLSRQTLPQPKKFNKLYQNAYSSIFQNIHPWIKGSVHLKGTSSVIGPPTGQGKEDEVQQNHCQLVDVSNELWA